MDLSNAGFSYEDVFEIQVQQKVLSQSLVPDWQTGAVSPSFRDPGTIGGRFVFDNQVVIDYELEDLLGPMYDKRTLNRLELLNLDPLNAKRVEFGINFVDHDGGWLEAIWPAGPMSNNSFNLEPSGNVFENLADDVYYGDLGYPEEGDGDYYVEIAARVYGPAKRQMVTKFTRLVLPRL